MGDVQSTPPKIQIQMTMKKVAGMERGNGGPESNGAVSNGEANGHVGPLRAIHYRVLGGGPLIRYFPRRFPRCACRETFSYPNELVLSTDDERRQLLNGNRSLADENEGLRVLEDV